MFGKDPSSEWFDELNPVLKLWMYENWAEDLREKNEFSRQYSILIGSFSNPKMAEKMWDKKSNKYETDDQQFEDLTQNIKELIKKEEQAKNKRPNRINIG